MAYILNGLAELYAEQGRSEEAEPLYKRSQESFERLHGAADGLGDTLAYALHGLGTLYRNQQRFREAETLFGRALTLREKTLEPDHPDLVALRKDYATLLRSTGRNDEADDLLAQNSGDQP